MLKLRSLPLRAGSLQDVVGGATKSSHVMLSGLTHFWGSIGAKGANAALGFRCAGKADAVSSIAAASTTTEADERPDGAIAACICCRRIRTMLWPSKQRMTQTRKQRNSRGSDVIKKKSYIVLASPV